MGVTPELCGLWTDSGGRVIAVDKSASMIQSIWPGRLRPGDEAICADWRGMPLATSSIDFALGDGFLSTLKYPSDYSVAFSELHRVLARGGRCAVRCFAQLDNRETPEEVFADLDAGRIGSFAVFKWRLNMAFQPDAATGVAVKCAWHAVNDTWKDLNIPAERYGWPIEDVLTINAYRTVDTRFSFPTRPQYCTFFSDAGFSVIRVATPSYELGERCPTFILERRDGPSEA